MPSKRKISAGAFDRNIEFEVSTEMRADRAYMEGSNFQSSRRLKVDETATADGARLAKRREREARLFEQGLDVS